MPTKAVERPTSVRTGRGLTAVRETAGVETRTVLAVADALAFIDALGASMPLPSATVSVEAVSVPATAELTVTAATGDTLKV